MQILDSLVVNLRKVRGFLPHISNESGVPVSTVRQIAGGYRKNPTIKHVQALIDYFEKHPVDAHQYAGVRRPRIEKVGAGETAPEERRAA